MTEQVVTLDVTTSYDQVKKIPLKSWAKAVAKMPRTITTVNFIIELCFTVIPGVNFSRLCKLWILEIALYTEKP